MEAQVAARAEAVCPRCGYDLRGAVASWTSACPLGVTCSECGLGFDCREVLNPVFAVQAEFFEHVKRRRVRALVRTAWRALRPRRFWGWVGMVHEVRVGRMVVGAVGGAGVLYVAAVVLGMLIVNGALSAQWLATGAGAGGPSGPFAYFSWGEFEAELALSLGWPVGNLSERFWWRHERQPFYAAAGVGLLAALLMPMSFLLLPVTLRRAKVRRVHLVRLWAYSWIGLMPLLVGYGLLTCVSRNFHEFYMAIQVVYDFWGRYSRVLLLVIVLLWLFAWWSTAAARYLRLPRPWGVAGAMVAISGLAAMLIVLALTGPALVDDLGMS